MGSKTLVFVLAISLIISILGLSFFVFEDGFWGRGHGMSGEIPKSFWLVLFIVPLVIATTVLGYAVVFPELNEEKFKRKPSSPPTFKEGKPALDAVLRVLNEDERKVIKTLVSEGGTMLQKDIRWKTGLSRVKTHRILYRLAKREIVTTEKYYNTNKITLAEWLAKETKSDAT
jgi:hypothetical protein